MQLKGVPGSAVSEYFASKNILVSVLHLGLEDSFPLHGSRNQILELNGLSEKDLKKKVLEFKNSN